MPIREHSLELHENKTRRSAVGQDGRCKLGRNSTPRTNYGQANMDARGQLYNEGLVRRDEAMAIGVLSRLRHGRMPLLTCARRPAGRRMAVCSKGD